MTREELKKNIRSLFYSSKTVEKYLEKAYTLIDKIYNDHKTTIEILMKANEEEISRHFNECEKYEAQLKAKDEEIERLKKAIDTSIEEIEYAIKKPQYAEVYLGNAIRFLKDNE